MASMALRKIVGIAIILFAFIIIIFILFYSLYPTAVSEFFIETNFTLLGFGFGRQKADPIDEIPKCIIQKADDIKKSFSSFQSGRQITLESCGEDDNLYYIDIWDTSDIGLDIESISEMDSFIYFVKIIGGTRVPYQDLGHKLCYINETNDINELSRVIIAGHSDIYLQIKQTGMWESTQNAELSRLDERICFSKAESD